VRAEYDYNPYGIHRESQSSVYFTIDTIPPDISFLSIENKTYQTADLQLNIVTNEPILLKYSLDNQANVTSADNTTIAGLTDGMHSLTIYATDIAGNAAPSETIHFSVEAAFLTSVVAAASAAIVAVGAVVLVYFKKHRH
jgi:hypothetical protein